MSNATELVESYIKSVGADRIPDQRPGDYIGESGLLICGTCGKARQYRIVFPDGTERLVRSMCDCEQRERTREKQRMKAQEEAIRIKELRNLSLLDDKYRDATFRNYEQDADNTKALKVARNYVANFDAMASGNQGILFHGPVGTGKTYTAACIANELLDSGVPVVMTSLVMILQEIRKPDIDEQKYLQKFNRAKLLILDDLGVERNTDYALEKTYNVIDGRIRSNRPLILTTNLTWDELTKEPDIRYRRIFDRILEVCYPVYVPGKSRRIRKAAGKMQDTKRLLEA